MVIKFTAGVFYMLWKEVITMIIGTYKNHSIYYNGYIYEFYFKSIIITSNTIDELKVKVDTYIM